MSLVELFLLTYNALYLTQPSKQPYINILLHYVYNCILFPVLALYQNITTAKNFPK